MRSTNNFIRSNPVADRDQAEAGGRPTVLIVFKKYAPRPHKELMKIDVTLGGHGDHAPD